MQSALDLVDWLARSGAEENSDESEDVGSDGAEEHDTAQKDPRRAAKPALARNSSLWYLRDLLGGRLDGRRVGLMGHSFGAATCIGTAERDTRARCVVSLDPWAFPLSHATLQRGVHNSPTLTLCGDGFTVWRENAAALRLLYAAPVRSPRVCASEAEYAAALRHQQEQDEDGGHAEGAALFDNGVDREGRLHARLRCAPDSAPHPGNLLLTLAGTEHQNFADFAVVAALPLRLMKLTGRVDPAAALRSTCELAAAYLGACGAGFEAVPVGTVPRLVALPAGVELGRHVLSDAWEEAQ